MRVARHLRSGPRNLKRLATALLFALVAHSSPLTAQVAPNADWRTIRTEHFYVHFTPPTEGLARRIAGDAERAYTELSRELHPPRGMIDIVLSDDVDFSNGYATPYPTNRIVIYANPPVSESALRYTNDWGQLVVTHELTHIFHLDRTRGIWALGQDIFGRAAALFPNSYDPAWLTEGLAVYEESKLTGAGRIEGSEHRMIARAAAIDHTFPSLGAVSLATGRYPFGEAAYAYGSLFVDYLAKTQGEVHVREFVEKSSANAIPYLINLPSRQAFGISFSTAWKRWTDSMARSIASLEPSNAASGWRPLTRDGVFVYAPRWLGDTAIVYSGSNGRESFGAFRVNLSGVRHRVGRRNSSSANVSLGNNTFLYSQLEYVTPYQVRSDLWTQHNGRERRLTYDQRLTSPDARADGEIVASQVIPGATRLVRVSRDGKRITPVTGGSYDEQWTEPRWSQRGDRIAAVRWLRGNLSQIVVLDTLGHEQTLIASGHSIQSTPTWAPGDAGIFYSSDWTGSAEVYFVQLNANGEPGVTDAVSRVPTGMFEPQESPKGDHLASVLFRADGYHLGVAPCCDPRAQQWTRVAPPHDTLPVADSLITVTTPATRFSPWRTFWPRYWLPTIDQGIDGGYRIGGLTGGVDVVGRHAFNATLEIPTNNTGVTGNVTYQYSGFGLPIIQLDATQDWQSLGGIFARTPGIPIIGELFRRTWTGDATATWLRQRYRTSLTLTGGVGIERRTHVTTPDNALLAEIDTTGAFGTPTFPSLIAAAGFGNSQRPPFSISPEDGVQLAVTVRDRLRSGAAATGQHSVSTVVAASLYKSLDLPGFAHHVLALRGAAGIADDRAAGYYSVGGVSGSLFQVIPGYTLGEGQKTFPVRGFNAGTLFGTRAFTGSAEYRVPLFMIGGAPGPLPFFFDRSSLTIFGDAGTAWCPAANAGREVCTSANQTQRVTIGSVGAELNLTLGVLSWDSPYRFRFGVAHPMQNGAAFGRPGLQVYVVSGIAF